MTCEYGCPVVCGKPATWACYPRKYPGTLMACDQHAPLMVEALDAHRLASAPPLPLPALKEYVTALAWQSVLLRDSPDRLRADNARFAFRNARDEYERRRKE